MSRGGGRGKKRGGGGGGNLGSGFSGEDFDFGDEGPRFQSQDRDGRQGGGGGGGGRKFGGDAGGGGRGGKGGAPELTFQRHIPKFLQSHAHLLESYEQETLRKKQEAMADFRAYGTGQGDDDDWAEEEKKEQEELLRKAIESDPTLAPEYRANEEKDKGNKAFSEKRYSAAVAHFSLSIELEPTNETYWSNRSAAHCALKDYDRAESDARHCVRLKGGWAKGWARLGAALHGMEDYEEAIKAYDKAIELDEGNGQYKEALDKAKAGLEKQQAEGRIKFRKKVRKVEDAGMMDGAKPGGGGAAAKIAAITAKLEGGKAVPVGPSLKGKREREKEERGKFVLSFAGEEEEEEED